MWPLPGATPAGRDRWLRGSPPQWHGRVEWSPTSSWTSARPRSQDGPGRHVSRCLHRSGRKNRRRILEVADQPLFVVRPIVFGQKCPPSHHASNSADTLSTRFAGPYARPVDNRAMGRKPTQRPVRSDRLAPATCRVWIVMTRSPTSKHGMVGRAGTEWDASHPGRPGRSSALGHLPRAMRGQGTKRTSPTLSANDPMRWGHLSEHATPMNHPSEEATSPVRWVPTERAGYREFSCPRSISPRA